MTTGTTGAHRVVIVGAGFGGLFAAKFLRRAPVEVTLVDRTNHHLFQPLLYQVATGILSAGEVAPATRDVLRKHANVSVELGDVTGFDLDGEARVGRTAGRIAGHAPVRQPDRRGRRGAIVFRQRPVRAVGARDEVARRCARAPRPDFRGVRDGRARGRPDARRAWLTFVVVGGGPTGVEIAGQIAELARRALHGNFRRIDPAAVRVILFDGGKEILATFGDKLSEVGTRELERTGVEIHVRSIVTDVDADGVEVKGPDGSVERYPAKTKIWAAGVAASPLAKQLADASGAECDRAGRVKVLPDCSLPGHPEVFVVGDMMNLDDLPGVAEVAMQTGIHAARTIKKRLNDGKGSAPFKYRDLGSMAAVSRRRAIVSFHGLRISGFPGWLMWLGVHVTFMTGFKNRFTTLFSWALSFLGRGRNERAITTRIQADRR